MGRDRGLQVGLWSYHGFLGSIFVQLIVKWPWTSSSRASVELVVKGKDACEIWLGVQLLSFWPGSLGNNRPNRHRSAQPWTARVHLKLPAFSTMVGAESIRLFVVFNDSVISSLPSTTA